MERGLLEVTRLLVRKSGIESPNVLISGESISNSVPSHVSWSLIYNMPIRTRKHMRMCTSAHMHTHESILSTQARLLIVTHNSMLFLETLPSLAAGIPSLLSSFTIQEASVQGLSSVINPFNTRVSFPSSNNSRSWHFHTTHLDPESHGVELFYLIFPIRQQIPCGFLSVNPAS